MRAHTLIMRSSAYINRARLAGRYTRGVDDQMSDNVTSHMTLCLGAGVSVAIAQPIPPY